MLGVNISEFGVGGEEEEGEGEETGLPGTKKIKFSKLNYLLEI